MRNCLEEEAGLEEVPGRSCHLQDKDKELATLKQAYSCSTAMTVTVLCPGGYILPFKV